MANKVVIMIGLPGCGKSTYIQKWQKQMEEHYISLGDCYKSEVCSADNYFRMIGTEYKFDPTKLSEAHGTCLRKFVSFLNHAYDLTLFVDNTNTSVTEIAPYAALALAYGCSLELAYIKCDPKVAAARNIHGVSEATIMEMQERINKTLSELPPWWTLTVIEAE